MPNEARGFLPPKQKWSEDDERGVLILAYALLHIFKYTLLGLAL